MAKNENNFKLYALTGTIGSGKSTATEIFKEFGAYIIDADQLARLAVKVKSKCLQDLTNLLGPEILNSDQELDRKKLSQIIFNDSTIRKKVENIIHPEVHKLFLKQLEEIPAEFQIVIYSVPLLFESEIDLDLFNAVISVTAPEEQIIKRLQARDTETLEQIKKKIAAQMSQEQKIELSSYVINNDKNIEDLKEQVHSLFSKLATN